MLNQNKIHFFLSIISILLLTGCWDSIEIEQRGFISGIAVDLVDQYSEENPQLTLTDQIVVPAGIGTSSSEGGGGGQPAFRNLSQSGESLINMNTKLSKRANRTLFSQHLEVLLFSEDVVKQPGLFKDLLDVFTRGQEMRRGMKIAVAKEQASPLLEIAPEHVKLPSLYISTLMENQRSAEVSKPLRLGDVQEYLFMDMSFIFPYLYILDDKSIENEGVAVYNGKDEVVVGTLNGELTKARNLLTGDIKAGSVKIPLNGAKSTIHFSGASSKWKLVNKDKNNLTFEVDIDVTGDISETTSKANPFDNLEMHAKALEKTIKDITEKTINKAQTELKTDIFNINFYLHNRHYDLWESIKDEWDTGENYFANSQIDVNVNVTLEHSGNTLYTTDKEEG